MAEHPMLWKVRTRWAAVGAAVAVVAGAGGIAVSDATNSELTPAFTSITPCRLMDTRAGSRVGPRGTPLGNDTTHTVQVTGRNGECNLPRDVSTVVMNVTLVNPAQGGFITVFPGGTTRPNASNLNYVAGQAPTANQVNTGVSTDGRVSFFAKFGPVDLVADVVGYFTRPRLSTAQLAQGRWDLDRGRPVSRSGSPLLTAMAFDGTRIWATRPDIGSISPLDPVTGEAGAALATGGQPTAIAFDGSLLWVANGSTNTVSRVDPVTGTKVGTDLTGFNSPAGLAFDGTNMWVSNLGGGTVTKIDVATATRVGNDVAVGAGPGSMVFDGSVLWIATATSLARVTASTATFIPSNLTTGGQPTRLAFDGENVWATIPSLNTVARFSPATGARVGSLITTVTSPSRLVFDGRDMWVGSSTATTLVRLDTSSGSVLSTVDTSGTSFALGFDGATVWASTTGFVLHRYRAG